MIWDEYPYSNVHELNLNWILNKVLELIREFAIINNNVIDLENDIEDLKLYIRNQISDEHLKSLVEDTVEDLISTGQLEEIVETAIQNLEILPTSLNMKRLGTQQRTFSGDTYANMQGGTLLDDGNLAIYYINNDESSGIIRIVNPETNETIRQGVIPAEHGQSVAYDGTSLHILHLSGGDTQYITNARADDLSQYVRKQILFNEITGNVWALAFNKNNNKLYGFMTVPNNTDKVYIIELLEESLTYTVQSTVYVEKFNTTQAYISASFYNNLLIILNCSNTLSVYYFDTLQQKQCINLPEKFNDNFLLHEPEFITINDNGDTYIGFLGGITSSGQYIASGQFLCTIGFTNITKNISRYLNANDLLFTNDENIILYVSNTSGAYANNGQTESTPLSTISIALAFKYNDKHINIKILSDDTENYNNMLILSRNNLTLEILGTSTFIDYLRIYHCDNINVINVNSNKVEIIESDVTLNSGSITDELIVNSSKVIDNLNTLPTLYTIDDKSIFHNPTKIIAYYRFNNCPPYMARWSHTVSNPTIDPDDNMIHTGFKVVPTRFYQNALQIGLTFNDGSNRFHRGMISLLGSDIYFMTVTSSTTSRKVRLRLIDNELLIQSIEGLTLSAITSITISGIN